MNRFLSTMIFCLVFLWASFSVAAPVPVGEVTAIRGQADAVGPDQIKRSLALKAQIFSDDIIVTGQKARLQVMFRDNTIISMGPDSEIKIDAYSLADHGGTMKTKVKEGIFHIMGGSIAKETPENFVTETPVATIGIRGSMFAFTVRKNQLSVVFLGGKGIDVFNSAGNVAITNPGFGTIVTDIKTIPEPPRKFAGDELQNILQMTKPGESDEGKTNGQKSGGNQPQAKPQDGKPSANQAPSEGPPSDGQSQKTVLPPLQEPGAQGIQPQAPKPPVLQPIGPKPSTPGVLGVMNVGPLPLNTVNDVVNTNFENKLNTIVQTEQKITATGRQQSFRDIVASTDPLTLYSDTGIVEAYIYKDHVSGFVQNQKGEKSGFDLSLPARDPSAPYSGFQKLEHVPGKRVIAGVEERPENMTVAYSSTGTFLIFGMEDFSYVRDTNSYLYTELGFTGVKALQEKRPDNGISVFKGPAIGFAKLEVQGTEETNGGTGNLKLMANWHNNKIFGFVDGFGGAGQEATGTAVKPDKGAPVFIMGNINQDNPVVDHAVSFGYYRTSLTIPFSPQPGNEPVNPPVVNPPVDTTTGTTALPPPPGSTTTGTTVLPPPPDGTTTGTTVLPPPPGDTTTGTTVLPPPPDGTTSGVNTLPAGTTTGANTPSGSVSITGNIRADANALNPPASGYSPIVWAKGELKGEFYGSQFDGFGFLSGGKLTMLQGDQTNPSGGYTITSAGFRNPEMTPSTAGISRLQGFAFGISENMDRPDRDTRIFMNSKPEDFVMSVNRDDGTLDGIFRANDILGSGASLSDIRIGGSNMSAYINDGNFAALIDGSDSVKSPDGTVSGLKPNGNYLVTDIAERKLTDYTSWGYWELSYDETTGGVKKPYHMHQPGSMWIAGEMTPESKMNDLRQTGFKGLYEGSAVGVWYANPGTIGGLQQSGNIEGTSRVQVDFSPSAVSQLTGDINFADKGILLKFQSERIAGTAFHVDITNAQHGNVNGAFFGPNADSVAGSFGAKLQDGNIMGVFGAGIKRAP